MRVLVVSWLFSAVRDAIEKDGDNAKGMPGFLKAMQYFAKNGLELDYVFITPVPEDKNILQKGSRLSFLRESQIKEIIVKHPRLNRYAQNFFLHRQLHCTLNRLCRENTYDFIYAMTPEAVYANDFANKRGIPCGMRLFGTFLWSFLQKNGRKRANFFFKDEIKAYNTQKKFLLTTNDGSNGDDSYEAFCKDKTLYDFHYWVNGLDRLTIDEARKAEVQSTISCNDILYVATVTRWKRHDRALELIKLLKDQHVDSKLLLIGSIPPESAAWKQELDRLIEQYGIQDRVEFRGSMAREDFLYLAMKAKVCALFQDTTNMGNVFHELFSVGAVIVSLNDGSLDGFIENGKNGFLVDTIDQAADIAKKLINNEMDLSQIRENAISTSQKLISSWDERFQRELELITEKV